MWGLSGRVALLILFMLVTADLFSRDSWAQVYTKEGITVYSRPVPGFPYDEFRGTGRVDGDTALHRSILEDVAAYRKWMSDCVDSKLVIPKKGNSFTYYVESYAPWPMSNRDGVYSTRIIDDGERINYIMNAVDRSDLVPLKSKIIRQTESEAHWSFVIKDGTVELTYYIRTNPGGNLSPSLFNATGADLPYKNITAFRKRVAELQQ